MFVYPPLVGENDDDRNEDERARGRLPQKRRRGKNACAWGDHRSLTVPGPVGHVKGSKTDKPIDAVRKTGQSVAQMSRRTNASKKSIIAFVAPFTHR